MKGHRFTTKALIYIALMAAIGIAVKPLVKTLTHIISTPLGIPGGTIGGGFYMMWLCLVAALVPRFYSATLTGMIQGIVVIILGLSGSHGGLSIITYVLPALTIDILASAYHRRTTVDGQIIYCIAANLVGTYLVGWIIMRLPKVPMLISLSMAIVSGCIGGALTYIIYRQLKKYRLT